MRILIVGATGYIGAWLCQSLSKSGFEVLAWGRRQPKGLSTWAKSLLSYHQADIRQDSTITAMAKQAPDAVLYCLSMDHRASEKNIALALKVNVEPVWKLLDLLSKGKKPIRFIYFSTAHVYGSLVGYIDEQHAIQPKNHYALTHSMAEAVLLRYHQLPQCSCVSLRLSNSYGIPYFKDANCWWLVINDLCQMAVKTGQISLQSDGQPQRDFVHIEDIANAVQLILSTPIERLTFLVYNLGSGKTYRILALAQKVVRHYEKLGVTLPIMLPTQSPRLIQQNEPLVFSIERLSVLGYHPKKELSQGISDLINYLNNGEKKQ